MKVLLVEDEKRIAAFLVKGLVGHGYTVDCVDTGKEGLARMREPDLKLAILDLGLPDMDGLDVLRSLRNEGSQLPVIILTARGGIEERVEGLGLGADDYLSKPFAFDELVARLRARMRDRNGELPALEAGGVRADPRTRVADVDGRQVGLTDREFALLEAFLRSSGRVLSREQLISQVWGAGFAGGTNVVDVYVGCLRRKLGKERIQTVREMGYRLASGG